MDIAAYLPPESGISEDELLQILIARFAVANQRKRRATLGKVGGRMTMMAVEATVPFPSSRYRSRPESGPALKMGLFGTFQPTRRLRGFPVSEGCFLL